MPQGAFLGRSAGERAERLPVPRFESDYQYKLDEQRVNSPRAQSRGTIQICGTATVDCKGVTLATLALAEPVAPVISFFILPPSSFRLSESSFRLHPSSFQRCELSHEGLRGPQSVDRGADDPSGVARPFSDGK